MATNRRVKRATASVRAREVKKLSTRTFYRVTPIFRNEDGKLEEAQLTSLVDCGVKHMMGVSVPVTTSMQKAAEIEERFTLELKKPVLVFSRNILFCKFEKVDGAEVAELIAAQLPKKPSVPVAEPGKVTTTEGGVKVVDKRASHE